MNIDINVLKKQKKALEEQYDALEKDICNHILSSKEPSIEIKKLESKEKIIDKKINTIEKLINYLTNIPILYQEIKKFDNELKRIESE